MPSNTRKTKIASKRNTTMTASMRAFLTRSDKARSPPIKMVNLWSNAYGLAQRLTPEFEGRYKFENPSSSERRRVNKKYTERAKTARAKLGVNDKLIPHNFEMGETPKMITNKRR